MYKDVKKIVIAARFYKQQKDPVTILMGGMSDIIKAPTGALYTVISVWSLSEMATHATINKETTSTKTYIFNARYIYYAKKLENIPSQSSGSILLILLTCSVV